MIAFGGEVVVREDGTFGNAGGAGCVDDRGRVITVQSDSRDFGGTGRCFVDQFRYLPDFGRRSRERPVHNHGFRADILENVCDFALFIKYVDGNEDDSGRDAGEIEVDYPNAVPEVNAQPIATRESAPVYTEAIRRLRRRTSSKEIVWSTPPESQNSREG